MVFHWPQITLVAIYLLIDIVYAIVNRESARSLLRGLAWNLFIFWLLYKGGFFAGVTP